MGAREEGGVKRQKGSRRRGKEMEQVRGRREKGRETSKRVIILHISEIMKFAF